MTQAEPNTSEQRSSALSNASGTPTLPPIRTNRAGAIMWDAYMTVADQMRAEGRVRGHADGREEGRTAGQADLLLSLLTLKFGPPADGVRERVRAARSAQLQVWAERMLTATVLEGVFA